MRKREWVHQRYHLRFEPRPAVAAVVASLQAGQPTPLSSQPPCCVRYAVTTRHASITACELARAAKAFSSELFRKTPNMSAYPIKIVQLTSGVETGVNFAAFKNV